MNNQYTNEQQADSEKQMHGYGTVLDALKHSAFTMYFSITVAQSIILNYVYSLWWYTVKEDAARKCFENVDGDENLQYLMHFSCIMRKGGVSSKNGKI